MRPDGSARAAAAGLSLLVGAVALSVALAGCAASTAGSQTTAAAPAPSTSPGQALPEPDLQLCLDRSALGSELAMLPASAADADRIRAALIDARRPLVAAHPGSIATVEVVGGAEPRLTVVPATGASIEAEQVRAALATIDGFDELATAMEHVEIQEAEGLPFSDVCAAYTALDRLAEEAEQPLIVQLTLDLAAGRVDAAAADIDDPRLTALAFPEGSVELVEWEGTLPTFTG
ncbi:hypothetical protein [Agrococcus sediminis]|uniref:hypothetical protein n=1 Tax=Agrococcus sediminis TaxID=2599924 RepID=UPI0013E3A636|nr:hypothetical protein [Agrococcus sediminis]